MIKFNKILKEVPAKEAHFKILIVSRRGKPNLVLFKISQSLNSEVDKGKNSNGIYDFIEHKDIAKWVFCNYKRHISDECQKFLFNYYPEYIEHILGVKVLHSPRISVKKFEQFFDRVHSGRYREIFPEAEPEESEINKNFYEIKVSVDGRILNEAELFLVSKKEYKKWKAKYGSSTPFVITKQNQLKVS